MAVCGSSTAKDANSRIASIRGPKRALFCQKSAKKWPFSSLGVAIVLFWRPGLTGNNCRLREPKRPPFWSLSPLDFRGRQQQNGRHRSKTATFLSKSAKKWPFSSPKNGHLFDGKKWPLWVSRPPKDTNSRIASIRGPKRPLFCQKVQKSGRFRPPKRPPF